MLYGIFRIHPGKSGCIFRNGCLRSHRLCGKIWSESEPRVFLRPIPGYPGRDPANDHFQGCGIELNTGGFHYGLGEPNPCRAIIRRYRQLGGEIITIGADAHSPDKISYAFDKAADILVDCGFTYYTVFKDRKPEFIKL